jgi:L-asparagine transporter-like permease
MTNILIEAEAAMQKNVTERWKADLEHGNWLTRSVRPLVLVFLIVATVLMVFIDSGSIKFEVEEKWVDLLQLVLMTTIGAYFGGRSVEKYNKFKNGKN